ncbi:fimbrial protein [Enterobacter asburiae]|nr:fimbrial protein [Enterobacter asburiae]HCM9692221.1 fimbrial protein [Enterobacter asburiae]
MLFFFFIMFFGLFASSVNACILNGGVESTDTAEFPSVIVQRDAPIGTVIATQSKSYSIDAESPNEQECTLYYTMLYMNAEPSSIEHVYKTNVPGVGIRIFMSDYGGDHTADIPPTAGRHFHGKTYQTGWRIELVKTGNITSGVLQAGPASSAKYTVSPSDLGDGDRTVNLTSTNITQVQCSIKSSSLTFPMGNNISLDDVTSVTATADLVLDCDAQTNINITLNGTQNPDSTDSTVLALTGQGEAGVADGVGVQFYYNDKAIELNKALAPKRSAGGIETFPITAHYFQTKSQIMPGRADATAVINITYQ